MKSLGFYNRHKLRCYYLYRWKNLTQRRSLIAGNIPAAERANFQLSSRICADVLGVPRPDPTKPDDAENAYVLECSLTFHHADGCRKAPVAQDAEQAQAVRAALAAAGPVDVATLAKNSRGTKMDRIEDILKTLARLGQARGLADNRYVALGVPITCFGSFPMHG